MNSITNTMIANAQPTAITPRPPAVRELSQKIARLHRKLLRTSGQEQDRVLGKLIGLYRMRAAASDRGAA